MAYTLILTAGERKAFDWVGDRYATGDKLSMLLWHCLPYDGEWTEDGDITFSIPEHIAWQVHHLAEKEEFRWPCFAPDLATKLQDFCDSIV